MLITCGIPRYIGGSKLTYLAHGLFDRNQELSHLFVMLVIYSMLLFHAAWIAILMSPRFRSLKQAFLDETQSFSLCKLHGAIACICFIRCDRALNNNNIPQLPPHMFDTNIQLTDLCDPFTRDGHTFTGQAT